MPEEIKVLFDVPLLQFIHNDFPISFIVSVGVSIGVIYCSLFRILHIRYNERKIERLTKIYNEENDNVAE